MQRAIKCNICSVGTEILFPFLLKYLRASFLTSSFSYILRFPVSFCVLMATSIALILLERLAQVTQAS